MSAWRIGRGEPTIGVLGAPTTTAGNLGQFVDAVVRWIPGEVVAFYGAAIVVASDGLQNPEPSRSLWIALTVATGVLVVIAGMSAARTASDVAVRAVLGLAAFLIWSATIPLSGWMSFGWFEENPSATAIGAALIGLVFAKVADLIVTE